MSEFQLYEFEAIDKPLTKKEQAAVDEISSRVDLTPTSAVFTYSYRDFPGDPLEVLAKYFDAMLYLSNWGSKELAFRLPKGLAPLDAMQPYCSGENVELRRGKTFVVLSISYHPEGEGDWLDEEDTFDPLVGLRDQLLAGDLRLLYLGWLLALPLYEEDEDELEPPVPAGLRSLSPELKAFVELFGLDEDLLAVAAEASAPLEAAPQPEFEPLLASLPESERTEWLQRLLRGERHLDVQLRRRLQSLTAPPRAKAKAASPRRTAGQLWAAAEARAQKRRQRKHREERRAEQQRLEKLVADAPALWQKVQHLIDRKLPKAYDEAVPVLLDLLKVARHLGDKPAFLERLKSLKREYPQRPALLDRLRKVELAADKEEADLDAESDD